MNKKWVLPLLSVIGILFGIYMVRATTKPTPAPKLVADPAKAPYTSYVSGAGLIEASTENVKVGATTGGLVTKVFVKIGDKVAKGDALFQIDDGPKHAELARYQAALQSAEATLAKLKLGNRPEEIAKQSEQVNQAAAQLVDAQQQLKLREDANAQDARAVSQDDINQARNTVHLREAALAYQKHYMEELQAGTWAPDIKVQEAEVASARAQLEQCRSDLERFTVRSPLDGKVLQVKIHAGEYAPASQTDNALIMVGNEDLLSVRVDVDEQDAWRVQTGRPATAYVRGRSETPIALTFARLEPYVVPKTSLTGSSTERVDTRVLQVIYSFHRPQDMLVYTGQQMDVYIEADPLKDPGGNATSSKGGTK
ncbi:MAG: efflux RND transporter periplasmic adaptor subunit [Acidobacteriota bacterium]|nr:efflux RND transporter periplasmic adaptor subunit [Acidobacteriota bacterium]